VHSARNNGIQTESLFKSYGSVRALRGVNLVVKRGEIFGFLSPNGAGKTTTIGCLLDLIRPDSGSIHVLGLDPQANPVEVRSRVGYLPGEINLEPDLTVEQALRDLNDPRGNRGQLGLCPRANAAAGPRPARRDQEPIQRQQAKSRRGPGAHAPPRVVATHGRGSDSELTPGVEALFHQL
jgi:ABC-type Fe3+/spermidine/putrescine transport system ATPase subunit